MHVLITGAAGFIGSRLVVHAQRQGYSVTGLDCFLSDSYDSAIKKDRWAELAKLTGVTLVEADLRKSAPIEGRFDCIIHLAAMPGLVKSWDDIRIYSGCNIDATGNVARFAASQSTRLVHVSTSSVYGSAAQGGESLALRPTSPYGVTKLAAEHLIDAYRTQFDLDACVLRFFSVYGPGQRPDMAYNIFIRKLLMGETILLTGDGKQSRSNTFVDDICRGTLAATDKSLGSFTVNLCGNESINMLSAVSMLEEVSGLRADVGFIEDRPGDQRVTQGEWGLAHKILGFAPRVTLRDGLTQQFEWQASGSAASWLHSEILG